MDKKLIEEAIDTLDALQWNKGRINKAIDKLKQAVAPDPEFLEVSDDT